ncbi:MAG: ABC transporter ATP-binding protein [Desulfobulbaceae bacterium]|jgi:iron complex transport system ATP-binding protein|nr:ABC transporter ATP-binding protein [Desulfobulbaceae bacterium]
MAKEELLRLDNINFSYQKRTILSNISFSLTQGELILLLGPNGGGKTTLLKILLGLLQPRQGSVFFAGEPLTAYSRAQLARRIAYVPQAHREIFAYTVEEVALLGRTPYQSLFAVASAEDKRIAQAALEKLDIAHLGQRCYTEISGGERQLTLIARALVQGAELFIMDEPVSGLDYGNQMRLLEDIGKLAATGISCIMTSHFPDHALLTDCRAVLLHNGGIIADGAPTDVITRNNLRLLYHIEAEVLATPDGGRCFCLPTWAMREEERRLS